MKLTIRFITVICVAALLLASGSAGMAEADQAERMTIAMQEFVGYGLFYLAKDKGFDKEEGVDLVFVDEQLDSARCDAFKEGMLDCEAGTLDLLISKRVQGAPVAAVMALDRSYGADGVVAVAGIDKVYDLAGKKVALASGDVGETFLMYLLRKENIPFDKVIIVSKGPDEVAQAFIGGEADAAVTWEPQLSKALTRPDSHLIITSKEIPELIVDTLNVREDFIKKHPRAIKALMRAWFKALKYYREHPSEASGMIARYYKMPADEYRESVKGLRWFDYARQDDVAERKALTDAFNEITELKYLNGKISDKPSADSAIDTALLKGLYEDRR
jgi:NitT/TauT family transport system substrate-binding protein